MQTTALEPFGMAVTGLEIGALGQHDIAPVRRLIAAHRVVVFRDQSADDVAFIRFLRALGELTFTRGETPVTGAPELNIVSNVGRETPPRSVFHTDTSYVACPPAFTALRPVMLPDDGGATLFSDQVAAAHALPKTLRRILAGCRVLHQATGLADQSEAHWHPLLRRHPLTGETALYLSTAERCVALSDMPQPRARRLIGALYRRSIRPAGLYRHYWRTGDILVWDNRVTMHRADHDGVVGDRVLHRGMVLGEAPLAA